MSYASPTNNFDFESLFLEEEQEVPLNFYQSPTESSCSSSGTDHHHQQQQQQQQQQITYDVISDGYVLGNHDFNDVAQKKGLKQDDLAAANPFFNQTSAAATNQFSPLNPLNNFLFNHQNQKPGFVGYQNPQLMAGQLGMYFPHTFPNVFPQFGNQPFPFPNNNLLYTSPNTSPIGLTTSPNSNNSNPSNTLSNSSTTTATATTTTQPTAESKTKASRRKSAKKNTKSSSTTTTTTTTTNNNNSVPTTSPTSNKTDDSTPSTTTPEQQKISTPEPTDSDNSSPSSEKEENDSSSSSSATAGKTKSEEKKRKRKSKKDGKDAKALTPEEEKELKRQRRLIKNRESAQASRERKKVYIQGLEKKVDGLAQEFNELQGHVLTLEEENELLRQRLKMLGEVVEEPSHKKRKMVPMTSSGQMKVPIPMDSRSFANPFMLDFWSLFGMQQQLQQAQQQPIPDMAQLNPRATSSSRRVVMFIMLFCVAMFLVLPHSSDIKFDSSQPTAGTTTSEQPESVVTSRLSPASRKLASTTDQKEAMVDVSIDASQKPFVDEDFKKNVADIYQAFQQVRSDASVKSEEDDEEEEESTTTETADKSIVDDLASRINVVFGADKVSLSFPKNILVKKEDDMVIDEEILSGNSTYDEKIASLSTKLLKEICRVVRD